MRCGFRKKFVRLDQTSSAVVRRPLAKSEERLWIRFYPDKRSFFRQEIRQGKKLGTQSLLPARRRQLKFSTRPSFRSSCKKPIFRRAKSPGNFCPCHWSVGLDCCRRY